MAPWTKYILGLITFTNPYHTSKFKPFHEKIGNRIPFSSFKRDSSKNSANWICLFTFKYIYPQNWNSNKNKNLSKPIMTSFKVKLLAIHRTIISENKSDARLRKLLHNYRPSVIVLCIASLTLFIIVYYFFFFWYSKNLFFVVVGYSWSIKQY